MTPAQREKLAKLLGMMGSSFDGEVLAAARAASALVRGAGLTWVDVLSTASPVLPPRKPGAEGCPWQAIAEECLDYVDNLNDWEIDFLESISWRTKELTPKQARKLAQIAERCRGKGRGFAG